MLKDKKNIKYMIGIILIFIGTLLPAIRIAQENISFLKDNGPLMIILVGIMFLLIKLEKKEFITLPSIISVVLIIKFIFDNGNRLKQINSMYNCYAKFQYGLAVILIGNLILLISLITEYINFKTLNNKINELKLKYINKTKTKLEKIKTKKQEKLQSQKQKENKKILTPTLIQKLEKKQETKKITKETTQDGKIKYNKITVKVDKPKEKQKLKERLENLILKLKLKKISRKKISLTKYQEPETKIKTKTYYIPTINIQRWTRDNVSCINCGAKINTNSEYCFLCDCKINLKDKEKKLS